MLRTQLIYLHIKNLQIRPRAQGVFYILSWPPDYT